MGHYIFRRLLLVPPTLFGILFLNFLLVQWAPGGPVEKALAEIQGLGESAGSHFSDLSTVTSLPTGEEAALYEGSKGLNPDLIKKIEALYGFDKPFLQRFWLMIKRYMTGDLGESYFKRRPVLTLILEKLPVSVSLGFWSTLLVYIMSISLGIAKARRHQTGFDGVSSIVVITGYAIPSFLFGLLLIVFFAGGNFLSIFPLRGLASYGAEEWSFGARVLDYAWHMVLPLMTQVLGGFASLTLLTKNAFLEEMQKAYVDMAYAKGLSAKQVLRSHVFRNAMLILVVGFPQAFLHIFFTGGLLTEVLFSLDGLGLLGFHATLTRDYPLIFGTLFIFTLLSMLMHILGDVLYVKVDPRLSFDREN